MTIEDAGGSTGCADPSAGCVYDNQSATIWRMTSWEQNRQVFDAIVLSNGWNDATAPLQLLSHLEGDALNVAVLVPMSRRTSRMGLVDALFGRCVDWPTIDDSSRK